ncbi:hypothetical protein PN451_17920 [Dolichospermum planctonicum CS-1226]|uniref:Uncharacterized protein n=1 Tax=Dolichospermum planctonicum CS-1226 TaxID=3021751 RepID=A0ABT5AK61_9CYAN|nr:hypothetical protein [Dolichospermum planctonicum CS-1226]
MLKLNLGCGFHTPISWLNVDYAIGAWLAKTRLFCNQSIKNLKLFTLTGQMIFFYVISQKNFLGMMIQFKGYTSD